MPSTTIQLKEPLKGVFVPVWAPVAADAHRCFVYSPRIGRLYLVTIEQLEDAVFRRILGLSDRDRRDGLEDPAKCIVFNAASFSRGNVRSPPSSLALLYRSFNASRRLVPFSAMANLAALNASRFRRSRRAEVWRVAQLGRVIYQVERNAGVADCYPRALLTLHLSILRGLACTLVVGVLAPTRKMHAWCVVEQQIPYEALPEHYLYQPLWVSEFASAA